MNRMTDERLAEIGRDLKPEHVTKNSLADVMRVIAVELLRALRAEREYVGIATKKCPWCGTTHERGMNTLCPITIAESQFAALPKWTRITDDPDTWPDNNQIVIYVVPYEPKYPRCYRYMNHHHNLWKDATWRPLCDLDYPPEDE